MSSIVLNVAFGLLLEKVRDHTAEKLNHGDLTDEQCRQLIVRELDDIKTKLDGLARKDLLSSVCFLKEGLRFLNLARDETTNDETVLAHEPKEDISEVEGATMMVAGNPTVFNEAWSLALSKEIRKLNIASSTRFTSAKRSFEKSSTEATRAFSNEALSIDDRILATKLRVISRILESLEDPDAAADACMGYLNELHDLPAIQEIFSVQLSGGMKSLFKKAKRLEKVATITMINFVVFGFAKKFTKTSAVTDWPTIQIGKLTYNPMMTDGEIFTKVEEWGVRSPNQFQLKEKVDSPQVNSKGEIIGMDSFGSDEVHKFTAREDQLFCALPKEDNGYKIRSLAIDKEDNVHIVTRSQQGNVYHYKLFVFDAKGNMKHQSPLEFLNGAKVFVSGTIAATDDIVVIHNEGTVYVCDSSGQLKCSIPQQWKFLEECLSNIDERLPKVHLTISDKNEIIVAKILEKVVYIYTKEGKLKERFEGPEDHFLCGVAFNHVTKEIIVLTERKDDFYLLTYSKTGELRRTLQTPFHCHNVFDTTYSNIMSHPSGSIALINYTRVLYIQ